MSSLADLYILVGQTQQTNRLFSDVTTASKVSAFHNKLDKAFLAISRKGLTTRRRELSQARTDSYLNGGVVSLNTLVEWLRSSQEALGNRRRFADSVAVYALLNPGKSQSSGETSIADRVEIRKAQIADLNDKLVRFAGLVLAQLRVWFELLPSLGSTTFTAKIDNTYVAKTLLVITSSKDSYWHRAFKDDLVETGITSGEFVVLFDGADFPDFDVFSQDRYPRRALTTTLDGVSVGEFKAALESENKRPEVNSVNVGRFSAWYERFDQEVDFKLVQARSLSTVFDFTANDFYLAQTLELLTQIYTEKINSVRDELKFLNGIQSKRRLDHQAKRILELLANDETARSIGGLEVRLAMLQKASVDLEKELADQKLNSSEPRLNPGYDGALINRTSWNRDRYKPYMRLWAMLFERNRVRQRSDTLLQQLTAAKKTLDAEGKKLEARLEGTTGAGFAYSLALHNFRQSEKQLGDDLLYRVIPHVDQPGSRQSPELVQFQTFMHSLHPNFFERISVPQPGRDTPPLSFVWYPPITDMINAVRPVDDSKLTATENEWKKKLLNNFSDSDIRQYTENRAAYVKRFDEFEKANTLYVDLTNQRERLKFEVDGLEYERMFYIDGDDRGIVRELERDIPAQIEDIQKKARKPSKRKGNH